MCYNKNNLEIGCEAIGDGVNRRRYQFGRIGDAYGKKQAEKVVDTWFNGSVEGFFCALGKKITKEEELKMGRIYG